jgi:hypothetical protein
LPSCAGEQQQSCAPLALADGWPITAQENVGMDDRRLCGIEARLQASSANVHGPMFMAQYSWPNIHGLVIIRHGKLVLEQYFSVGTILRARLRDTSIL